MADQKLRKIERSPLMLKDYLLDDLSSCSSNGFKSFPRKQCCTTVRFLLEIDLKTREASKTSKRRSKAASTLQALLKLLPFTSSVKSLSPSPSAKKPLLSKSSFSKKLFLKRSFWRKGRSYEIEDAECVIETNSIKPLKMFADFLYQPSDQNKTPIWSSKSNSNNSWAESDFTQTTLQSYSVNDTVEATKNDALLSSPSTVSKQAAGSVAQDSITKDWRNEQQEEKEQFSPVSVLDCPFEDDETDTSSPFHRRLAHMEGTKQKLMQKLRRFESLAKLEPIDLEKRMSSLEENADSGLETPRQTQDETEKNAERLLNELKSTASNAIKTLQSEALLLDFFKEMTLENQDNEEMLKTADDWISGRSLGQEFVGWEDAGSRKNYLNDMDKNGRWRDFVSEEKLEMVLDIERLVFSSLVSELLALDDVAII